MSHSFLLSVMVCVIGVPDAGAVDILVANNADSGNGTLRQAIQFNESLGGGNTIVFSNIVTGTITLTNALGELLISKPVTIVGPGAKELAISGNNTHRVFHLTNNPTVSISGLTITRGYLLASSAGGAGILQDSGTLALSDCIISSNYSANFGGGGISAQGTMRITGCTIVGNFGNAGGGIFAQGHMVAINCTVASNSAFYSGGGMLCGYDNVFLTNCTISANFTQNAGRGGGIYSDNAAGITTIRNSIIASNSTAGGTAWDCYGSFASAGFNLIGAINGSTGWGALGDQLGTTNNYLDPLLGPLQDNGGLTLTLAPLFGSPVRDQGNSSGMVTDQRGRPRPYTLSSVSSVPLGGDRSDIGACEVSEVTVVVSNLNDRGSGSLRQAIATASSFEFDTIVFAPGLAGTIALTTGELLIGKPMTIQGPLGLSITLSGNNASRVIRLTGTILVRISNLTIANGNSAGGGGGIYNDFGCVLALSNCAVAANISGDNGGGLANNGRVTAHNCTFSGNQAALNAGGIYTYAGPVTLRNCTIVSNTAVGVLGTGGGILNYSLQAGTSNNIGGTIVAGNTAASHPDVIGLFTSSGYNLIGKIDYSTAVGGGANGVITRGLTNNINHDLVGSLASPTNALLGPLLENGGPTLTHALKPGSPAIDRGISNGLGTDQRGAPRPFDFASVANASGGDSSDIGAFELGSPTLNLQTFTTNAILSWEYYYGDFTLQSVPDNSFAIAWATVAGTPVVSGSLYVFTNSLSTGNQFFRLKAK